MGPSGSSPSPSSSPPSSPSSSPSPSHSSSSSSGSWFDGGRVKFGGTLATEFRAFTRCVVDGALEGPGDDPGLLSRLAADCEVAFTARALEDSSRAGAPPGGRGGEAAAGAATYSSGETFWIGAGDAPRCALERLALGVFAYHARGAVCDPARSGAEWWTQCVGEDDEIGFHWDMDYAVAEEACLHPQLATVTYLTGGGGAPTLCLDKTTAWSPADSVEGDVARGWLSAPAPGKHIAFDGRWLHGAPTALRRVFHHADDDNDDDNDGDDEGDDDDDDDDVGDGDGGGRRKKTTTKKRKRQPPGGGGGGDTKKRVTFLVNVWLNHTPDEAAPLPAAACRAMRVPVADAGLRFAHETKPIPIPVPIPVPVHIPVPVPVRPAAAAAAHTSRPPAAHTFPFRHCGRDLALVLGGLAPPQPPPTHPDAGVLRLAFAPGTARVEGRSAPRRTTTTSRTGTGTGTNEP